ncbi:MAG: hypothetical protein IAI50_21845 [Candidatus Eremiobacteraeota bacterium]|nr:hypothetical protein [Candidatus Eremiobacteraeota bacterium]
MLRNILAGCVVAGTVGLAVATSAQPMPPQSYPYKAGPVTIASCSLGQSGNSVAGNSLEIKYFQNVPRRHLVSVTFRIRYAGTTATVTDTGKFSYDATIDHKFDTLGGTPWAGPDPQSCQVVSATFGDGQMVKPMDMGSGGGPNGGPGGPPGAMSGPPGAMSGPPATMPPYATQPGAPAPAAT